MHRDFFFNFVDNEILIKKKKRVALFRWLFILFRCNICFYFHFIYFLLIDIRIGIPLFRFFVLVCFSAVLFRCNFVVVSPPPSPPPLLVSFFANKQIFFLYILYINNGKDEMFFGFIRLFIHLHSVLKVEFR